MKDLLPIERNSLSLVYCKLMPSKTKCTIIWLSRTRKDISGQITIICLIRVTLMISSSADIQTLNGIFLSKRLILCTAKKKLKMTKKKASLRAIMFV